MKGFDKRNWEKVKIKDLGKLSEREKEIEMKRGK